MEWDEGVHYNYDGSLRERDINRQGEIKRYYSNFRFLRINEITEMIIQV